VRALRLALAAVKGEKTLAELAAQFDVHAKIGELTLTNDFLARDLPLNFHPAVT
jgi:hypothetical protein